MVIDVYFSWLVAERRVKVDLDNRSDHDSEQKASTPRSKHSATEQRRRTKINERCGFWLVSSFLCSFILDYGLMLDVQFNSVALLEKFSELVIGGVLTKTKT